MDSASGLNSLKRQAGESAAGLVEDGMVVGLGTGSTAAFVVDRLGQRVRGGLRITGIPTSESTAERARKAGIALIEMSGDTLIDLTIDGADEVETGSLNLIKGRGGALLREKIVASASTRLVIVVDETKVVERLGRGALPVEIVPFGHPATMGRLRDLGATPVLRLNSASEPFVTDGGHYIADCMFGAGFQPASLQTALDGVVGVVEHGLFVDLTAQVFVAGTRGLRILSR